jgi:formate dehydrogenase subunit gamma
LRFDWVERSAHWANALLFVILILTALPLYFSGVEGIIGRRALVAEIHLWAGLALPIPLLVSLAGPWGARFRRDVRRFSVWTTAEVRWLMSFGRRRLVAADKFNPGQKLNALFIAGSIVVMLASGAILKWFQPFPVNWRTGATLVHEVFAWIIVIVIVGHIVMAVTHPDALRSIFRGWVTEAWAKRHAAGWLKEEPHELGS